MAHLEIRPRSGATDVRSLDRKSPVTIGSSPAADVRLSATGVQAIECRILWNGSDYQLAAVNPEGVNLNGTTVRKGLLSDGDRLRIADTEFVFVESDDQPVPPAGKSQTDEVRLKLDDEPDSRSGRPAAPRPTSERAARKPVAEDRVGGDAFEVKQPASESRGSRQSTEERREGRRGRGSREERDDDDGSPYSVAGGGGPNPLADVLADVDPPSKKDQPMLARGGGLVGATEAATPSLKDSAKSFLRPKPRRPGEQDLTKSPLVVGMTIGAAVLALTAGTLWFVLAREFMNRKFETAEKALESGQFAQAIDGFTKFAAEYPKTDQARQAKVNIGKARVEQALSGAIPDWENGLKTLNDFVAEYRDSEDFRPGDSLLRTFARQSADKIALGAAKTAEATKRRPLLGTSTDARQLLDILSPPENKPEEQLAAISAALKSAEAAILQQETFDTALTDMKGALEKGQPLAALQTYGRLLDRYAVAEKDRTIQTQLKGALEAEKSSTARRENPAVESQVAGSPADLVTLGFTRRQRVRTDVASVGTTTVAVSEGGLFACDAVTGEVLWRRAVGQGIPFPPVAVQARQAGYLAWDSARGQLICLAERTGEPLWTTPLASAPTGRPLIHEGQVFLTTSGATLVQVDLQSGERLAELQFNQPVIGPPAVSTQGDRMYVAGRESALYVLSRRPLACEHTVWLGQPAGSLSAPLLMLRDYLLLVETAGADKSLVRLLDTSRDAKAPREIARATVAGQVLDPPVVRGKQVIVASTPERLTAFVIAETGDAQSLTKVASYQVPGPQNVPMHVLLGPDDQFWMSSTALRRFDVKVDSIVTDNSQIAVGLTALPLTSAADTIYLGRRLPFSPAILLGGADRQKMVLEWQTVLGAPVLATTAPAADGSAVGVTAQGDVFPISAAKLSKGGFELQPTVTLPPDEKGATPLGVAALPDGRVAVWWSGESSRLWIVGNDSAPRETKLDLPLQTAPVRLAEGYVLPLPGRLRLQPRGTGGTTVQEWTAPVQASEAPAWRGLLPVDDTTFVALDATGRLMQGRYQSNPKPHLAEIGKWEAGAAVDLTPQLAGDQGVIAASDGTVFAIDLSSLEPTGKFALPRPATRSPVVVGDRVLVDSARQQLHCLDLRQKLQPLWQLPLEGTVAVGAVEHDGHLIVARDDGVVLMVEPATGAVKQRLPLYERLLWGPRVWGDRLVMATVDGALLSLPVQTPALADGGGR
jgi:outer membrane protein assembly factor BamB/TolA-binding protein/pSer/pThr/pTyr-binding forkhead associated (FHA) protein